MSLYQDLPGAYAVGHEARAGLSPAIVYLSERCAKTHDGVYWVRTDNGIWHECKSAGGARGAIEQNWLGGPHNVTGGDIELFFKGGKAPSVNGAMKVPTSAAPAIEFQGKRFINTWIDTIMQPDSGGLHDPLIAEGVTLLLRMIRESLCNKTGVKTTADMLEIANGHAADELEFRVIMAWLAAPLQEIGRNLQINLWLIGEMNGTGKGLLNALMTLIYGADNCVVVNKGDVEKGDWSDSLVGKLWVNINELDMSAEVKRWNTFFKDNSTEGTITIRKRNAHPFTVLNFTNWMVGSNCETPPGFDIHDRRHFIIAGTDDLAKANLSLQLFQWTKRHGDAVTRRMLAAFVAVLQAVQIDDRLLDRAVMTDIKAEAQAAAGASSDLEYWLVNDMSYPRDDWNRAHDYEACFSAYYHKSDRFRNMASFGGKLAKLARRGKIESRYFQNSRTQPLEYLIPSKRYPCDGIGGKPTPETKVISIGTGKRPGN